MIPELYKVSVPSTIAINALLHFRGYFYIAYEIRNWGSLIDNFSIIYSNGEITSGNSFFRE